MAEKKFSKEYMEKALFKAGWKKIDGYKLDTDDVDPDMEYIFFESPYDLLSKCTFYQKDEIAFETAKEAYDHEFGDKE